jgi:hypothetical protein
MYLLPAFLCPEMGRRATAEELLAQAEANGYKRAVRKQRDQVRHRKKHVKMAIRDQDATLRRYVLYLETPVLATHVDTSFLMHSG